jgi:hypothetical protein
VDLLLALRLVARVRLCNSLKTLPKPFPSGLLLRVGEQLVSLRPNLPPLVIGELVTHFFNQDQQRPPRTLTITTPFRNAPSAFNNWFRLLPMSQAAKNQTLGGQSLSEERFFATALKSIYGTMYCMVGQFVLLRPDIEPCNCLIDLRSSDLIAKLLEKTTSTL